MSSVPPPISPQTPVVWLLVSGVLLAGVVFWVVPQPGPLDHPDQAEQRTGVVVPAREAREVTGRYLLGEPLRRQSVVVVFDRAVPDAARLRAWVRAVPPGTKTMLALPQAPAAGEIAGVVDVVSGDGQRVADAVGMPTPLDGGYPIGYALIDARARVRYTTLDPAYLSHAFEVATMTEAVQ